MSKSILQTTTNFFRLYKHICGKSEVPYIFNFWAAVALIAAAVEDRVWYSKFKHEKLYANLFVLLVGPSGLGKGAAISQAMKLAEQALTTNRYRGRVTHAHLIDLLGKATVDAAGNYHLASPKLWLIMDELQNDIGSNKKLIEEFIYLMTELYTASSYTVNTGTRTHGQIDIEKPIVNWLVGTTEECLRNIITKDLLNSGFTARSCFIFGEYDFNRRFPQIKYPTDFEEVFQYLVGRLYLLQQLHGECVMSAEAETALDKWYMTRSNPEEELLFSAWKRHHDMLLKFAVIFCLAEGQDLVIQLKHIKQAKQAVEQVYIFSERLVTIGTENFNTKPSNELARYLLKRNTVKHSEALKYMRAKKGINAEQFRVAINALITEGNVRREIDDKGGVSYIWGEK